MVGSIVDWFGHRNYIGLCIRIARQEQGISIRELASRCDISANALVNMEGAKFTPRLDIVQRVLDELNVTIPMGALYDAHKDICHKIESDMYSQLQEWYKENWCELPNADEVFEKYWHYASVQEEIDELCDALGEIPTQAMLMCHCRFLVSIIDKKD
jgi:transcriptional regulator with XRE-family HTH domain